MRKSVNKMRPIHPGEILADELEALDLSARKFAAAIKVPTNRVTGILNGTRAITADTALRLSAYFGTSAEMWVDLQKDYELRTAEMAHGAAIRSAVKRRKAA